jgi:hypothetical protein
MANDLSGVTTSLPDTASGENQLASGLSDTTQLGTDAATTGDSLGTLGNTSKETGAAKAVNDANGSRNINETANQNDGTGTLTMGANGATGTPSAAGSTTGGGTGAAAGGGGGGCGGDDTQTAGGKAAGETTGGTTGTTGGTAGTAGNVAATASQPAEST